MKVFRSGARDALGRVTSGARDINHDDTLGFFVRVPGMRSGAIFKVGAGI